MKRDLNELRKRAMKGDMEAYDELFELTEGRERKREECRRKMRLAQESNSLSSYRKWRDELRRLEEDDPR